MVVKVGIKEKKGKESSPGGRGELLERRASVHFLSTPEEATTPPQGRTETKEGPRHLPWS